MIRSMRQPTLQTLGLGTVLEIFSNGRLPVAVGDLVEQVFGKAEDRGCLVISGINGIVGAGKAMQLGSRLEPFGVAVAGLDFPGVPDGIGRQYPGLVQAFGKEGADRVMAGIVRLAYDGVHLPPRLGELRPRFLLEAIPEILEIKKAHYQLFRENFPGIEIRSVTSGFPSSVLGVGVTHPAFPHEVNKVWEVVEPEPSPITQLFWALGLIPIPISDHWSFILDVLFCGITLAGLRYYQAANMPFWKIDKFVRKHIGPNPFRAHDVIGAGGANFLTWSCLHHLAEKYGELFTPTAGLIERRNSGQNWYPLDHFRPLVDWSFENGGEEEFLTWIQGPLFQMTSLLLHEKRSHLTHVNAMGELCAQFRRGILAVIRGVGIEAAQERVTAYHRLYPAAAGSTWYPEVFEQLEGPDWQQLYVNAEHDGKVGIITIGRESYNDDVNDELNRAIDWLKAEAIQRVIVTGDFHLAAQMIGADTSEFYPALNNTEEGFRISSGWSRTARRLHEEFQVSVGCVNGKRCLGGFLELLLHCHYLVAREDAMLGMPEVTLPVVPGMEGCHWPFRKTEPENWPRLLHLLLDGKQVGAADAVGWLVDFVGPLVETLQMAWKIATRDDHGLPLRKVEEGALAPLPDDVALPEPDSPAIVVTRKAILEAARDSCSTILSEALTVQARHSADFLASDQCRRGRIGIEFNRVMAV